MSYGFLMHKHLIIIEQAKTKSGVRLNFLLPVQNVVRKAGNTYIYIHLGSYSISFFVYIVNDYII